ncbi:zinc finger HIT domain-containing protein 2-like [Homarus americanus]|uniref:zinc finger HIT domain-containing protein 2-like n=1 Tax=Homarus americanus TaxID=6706 RepID=UPI001C486DAA|nr:zinc finger HIT domain-containing protein 2-like [Homarus americanus]
MASISDSHRTCNFCHNKSQYTCPRCNVPYCSSKCYKHQSHVQCSEGFFEEMVKAELGSGTVSEESRQKMMEILQRVKAGESGLGEDEDEPLDSDDDEDEEDLNVRMAGICIPHLSCSSHFFYSDCNVSHLSLNLMSAL